MFVDRAKVYVKAGDGGDGCVSFRREKCVPFGGPNGGDGGRGGDVVFVADRNMSTLLDFKYQQHLKAKRGRHGMGKDMTGQDGQSIHAKVPIGTLLKDFETDMVIHDFVDEGDTFIVAKGGRGGRGNTAFKSSTNRAPRRYEEGSPGEERTLQLELMLIADVGLVGCPNAGKSTLINKITAARSKTASYPFTTLSPVLGVVKFDKYQSAVIADIPGLIEGAHDNVGLGHDFLRHVERTKILLFIIDSAGSVSGDPLRDYGTLREELVLYSPSLADKPFIIALNKMDMPEGEDNYEKFIKTSGVKKDIIFPISALTGEGTKKLLNKIREMVFEAK